MSLTLIQVMLLLTVIFWMMVLTFLWGYCLGETTKEGKERPECPMVKWVVPADDRPFTLQDHLSEDVGKQVTEHKAFLKAHNCRCLTPAFPEAESDDSILPFTPPEGGSVL